MATVKVYHHGATAGVPPMKNSHERTPRGEVEGWSASSTRSNTRFLYSVQENGLTGLGFALSLTIRDCPDTHEDWHTLRTSFLKRLKRMGLIRCHWLTEWQRRGCPHLHAAVWFEPLPDLEPHLQAKAFAFKIISAWLELTEEKYRAGWKSQDIKPITDSIGWFKYLSKHASRGLGHYQRNPESIPKGWKKTGRMWGKTGEWPIGEPISFDLSMPAFWAYRRIIRGYRKSDARASKNPLRIVSARRMLQCTNQKQSAVRGVSEWVEAEISLNVMHHLLESGYEITT